MGDIIHAAGVRVLSIIRANGAASARGRSRGLRREPGACKLVAEIVEVSRTCVCSSWRESTRSAGSGSAASPTGSEG